MSSRRFRMVTCLRFVVGASGERTAVAGVGWVLSGDVVDITLGFCVCDIPSTVPADLRAIVAAHGDGNGMIDLKIRAKHAPHEAQLRTEKMPPLGAVLLSG